MKVWIGFMWFMWSFVNTVTNFGKIMAGTKLTTLQENPYHWSYLLAERVKEGGVVAQAFAWTG
jgi:hypothetical protein